MHPLPIFSPNLSKDIVKIAIQCEGKIPLLYEFHQKKTLQNIIEEICLHWEINDHFNYGLQFLDHSLYIFVQEKIRSEIKNGAILLLQRHPDIIVGDVISLLSEHQNQKNYLTSSKYGTSGSLVNKLGFTNYYHIASNTNMINHEENKLNGNLLNSIKVLKNFSRYCSDQFFAQLFINKGGLKILFMAIQNNEIDKIKRENKSVVIHSTSSNGDSAKDFYMYMLIALDELIQNGLIDWEGNYEDILLKVISYLKYEDNNYTFLKPTLSILDAFITNWYRGFGIFVGEININEIVPLLKCDNSEIQVGALILINSILNKAIEMGDIYNMIEQLTSNNVSDIVTKNFFKNNTTLDAEVLQNLKQLQHYLFIPIEREINIAFDENNQEHTQLLQSFGPAGIHVMDLFRNASQSLEERLGGVLASLSPDTDKTAFETLRRATKGRLTPSTNFDLKDYESDILPLLSQKGAFSALKSLKYFVTNYGNTLLKVVHDCQSKSSSVAIGYSLYQIALHITLTLAEILKISHMKMGTDEPGEFYLMFYSVPFAYHELFVLTFNLFLKTWKEMRASTSHDFIKVFTVVREQISRVLDMNPVTFEKFKQDLNAVSYPNLTQIWQRERYYKEELESQAPAIMELREHLKPRIQGIVVEHRLNFTKKGSLFTKYSTTKSHRLKDKLWHCNLSSNNKVIFYGLASDEIPPYNNEENLSREHVNVNDIESIKCGKDVIQAKELKNKKLCMWSDGLNYLVGSEARSQEFKNDLETILSMEIKIALLELETVSIPELPLSIPDDPPDFNFVDSL